MAVWKSSILPTVVVIASIAWTALSVSVLISATHCPTSSVAFAVCWASSLTSPATTAKPLPAAPARAASMVIACVRVPKRRDMRRATIQHTRPPASPRTTAATMKTWSMFWQPSSSARAALAKSASYARTTMAHSNGAWCAV
jgi:hypothetical protein